MSTAEAVDVRREGGDLTRRRRLPIGRDAALGFLGVAAVLVLWQVASVAGLISNTVLPSATRVLSELIAQLGSASLWLDLQSTMTSWLIGIALTILVAIPLGLLIGASPFVNESTAALVEFLKPIPPIAMIPLGVLLWGPSMTMKLTLIVFGSLWPLLTQVIYGVQAVDRVALAMSRSYRLGWRKTTLRVVVPGVMPYVMTGLKVSAAIALIVSIVTEMVGGVSGLGLSIIQAQNSNDLPRMYALIVLTGVLGLLVNGLFRLPERRLLHWHASQRGAGPR